MENFFGILKTEMFYGNRFNSAEQLIEEIEHYIDYYNNNRYQYQLAKLSPNEYLEYFKTGIYPLKDLVKEPEDIKYKFEAIKEDREILE